MARAGDNIFVVKEEEGSEVQNLRLRGKERSGYTLVVGRLSTLPPSTVDSRSLSTEA